MGIKPVEPTNVQDITHVNSTFTNEKKRVHNHLKHTKSSIQRAKSGYMQRKEGTVGNTFASAA